MTLTELTKTFKWLKPHTEGIFKVIFLLICNCLKKDRERMRKVALRALCELGGWLVELPRTDGWMPRNFLYSMCKLLYHEVTRLPFQRFLKDAPACGLTIKITVWGEQSRDFNRRQAGEFDLMRHVRGWGGPNHVMACRVAGMKTLKEIMADKASTLCAKR